MTESIDSVPLRIFMSYRRADTGWAAVSLFDRLADQFGRDNIFKDVDSIDLGEDFIEAISAAVGSSDALLALIGNQWLTVTDQNGRRRLDNPGDFVRLEIEAALTLGVRVIPILVDGALMPGEDQLPESLAPLVRRQPEPVR
jgi:TIR domain